MKWFFRVIQKYAVFSGRARRKEYWYFVLFSIIFAIPVLIIDCTLTPRIINSRTPIAPILFILYGLFLFLPSLALAVRRLHDISLSGWWILLNWVPVGGTVVFIFMLIPGTKGENEYGPDPLDEDTDKDLALTSF